MEAPKATKAEAKAWEKALSRGQGNRRSAEDIRDDNEARLAELLEALQQEGVAVSRYAKGVAEVETSACHGSMGTIRFWANTRAKPAIQAECNKKCAKDRVLGALTALAFAGGRVSVNVNGDAGMIGRTVRDAVTKWNDAEAGSREVLRHDLYRTGAEPYEQLVTLHENDSRRLVMKTVSDLRAPEVLSRSVNFYHIVGGADSRAECCYPTRDIRGGFLADLPTGIPLLDCVMAAPYLSVTGQIIATPGYDAENRCYLDWCGDWERMSRQKAVEIIDDYLGQFHTARQADAVNLRAAGITPFIARYVGLCPMTLLVKPGNGSGSGATTAAFAIAGVALQRAPKVKALSHGSRDKESADKAVFSALNSGETVVLFDNVTDLSGLNGLFAALTVGELDQRAMREQYDISVSMNGRLVLATGNGLRPTAELARRCLTITLDTGSATPALVKIGKDGQPYRYKGVQGMLAHVTGDARQGIVSAWLSLIVDWLEAGGNNGSAEVNGFERWGRVASGIMELAGMGTPMLDAEDRVREAAADDEQAAALALLLEWQGPECKPWTAAQAVGVLAPRGEEPKFPTRKEHPGGVAVSKWLRTMADKGAVPMPDGSQARVIKIPGDKVASWIVSSVL